MNSALDTVARVRGLLERIERALHVLPGVQLRDHASLRLSEARLADVWNRELANAWKAHLESQPEVPPEPTPAAPKVEPEATSEPNYWLDRLTEADAPAK